MTADCANRQLHHEIDIKVITDGEHHILDRLDPPYKGLFQMVITQPQVLNISVLRRNVFLEVG